jgi:hypothetical protein
MPSLFDATDRTALMKRLDALQSTSPRIWGKMNPAQMLTHCSRALETSTGDRPMKQAFLGKLITPFIRKSLLGDKPFGRNSPTDPTFVVADKRDFAREKKNLVTLIDRFVERGQPEAGKATHAFFGTLTGEEWGRLMYKHIDHHLQQFGA